MISQKAPRSAAAEEATTTPAKGAVLPLAHDGGDFTPAPATRGGEVPEAKDGDDDEDDLPISRGIFMHSSDREEEESSYLSSDPEDEDEEEEAAEEDGDDSDFAIGPAPSGYTSDSEEDGEEPTPAAAGAEVESLRTSKRARKSAHPTKNE